MAVDETIEDAARRELREEIGVSAKDLKKAGIIDFEFQGNPEILKVHLFRATDFDGKPRESEEMRPQWFSVGEIPFEDMWPDDKYWFPLFLAGKKFKGRFLFDGFDKIVNYKLTEVAKLI